MNDLLERFFGLAQGDAPRLLRRGGAAALAILLETLLYSPGPQAAVLGERTARLEELRSQQVTKARQVAQLEALRKKQVKDLDAKLKEALAQLPDQKEIPEPALHGIVARARIGPRDPPALRQRPNLQDFYTDRVVVETYARRRVLRPRQQAEPDRQRRRLRWSPRAACMCAQAASSSPSASCPKRSARGSPQGARER